MIQTENLRLVPCELRHFEALLGDEERAASELGVTRIADGWLSFPEALRRGYEHLSAYPSVIGWWFYLFISRADDVLIGCGGFKGEADDSGAVEIGYEIAPTHRGLGLATEAARGLMRHAFSHPHVRSVIAHTLAESNASTRVLERIGMTREGTARHPSHGDVWCWRLDREGR